MQDKGKNPQFDPAHPQRYFKGDKRASENGKKGGAISGSPEVRAKANETRKRNQAEKKNAQLVAKAIFDLGIMSDEDIKTVDDVQSFMEIAVPNLNIDVRTAAIVAQTKNMLDGDLKALQYLLNLIGEATPEVQEVKITEGQSTVSNMIEMLKNRQIKEDTEDTEDEE